MESENTKLGDNNQNQIDISDPEHIPDSESLQIIYNEILRLYNLEIDSNNILGNKAQSIILSGGSTIISFTLIIAQLIGKYHIIFMAILLPSYYPLVRSLIKAIETYKVELFSSVDANLFLNKYYGESKETILGQLSSNLAYSTDQNKAISRKRTENLDSATNYLILGIILIVFSIIVFFIDCCLSI